VGALRSAYDNYYCFVGRKEVIDTYLEWLAVGLGLGLISCVLGYGVSQISHVFNYLTTTMEF
jgi:hypothetical protein